MGIYEDIKAGMENLRDAPPRVCEHVVHPVEAERGGLARCANCFQVIDLGLGKGGSQ